MAENKAADKSTGAQGAAPANAAPGASGGTAEDVAQANQNVVASAQALGSDVVAPVDPKRDNLLARAQVRAPSMTAEFVDFHDLPDEYLEAIANGTEPPPPVNGPNPSTHLHFTPGGWQVTPLGVKPEEVGLGKGGYGPNASGISIQES